MSRLIYKRWGVGIWKWTSMDDKIQTCVWELFPKKKMRVRGDYGGTFLF